MENHVAWPLFTVRTYSFRSLKTSKSQQLSLAPFGRSQPVNVLFWARSPEKVYPVTRARLKGASQKEWSFMGHHPIVPVLSCTNSQAFTKNTRSRTRDVVALPGQSLSLPASARRARARKIGVLMGHHTIVALLEYNRPRRKIAPKASAHERVVLAALQGKSLPEPASARRASARKI